MMKVDHIECVPDFLVQFFLYLIAMLNLFVPNTICLTRSNIPWIKKQEK